MKKIVLKSKIRAFFTVLFFALAVIAFGQGAPPPPDTHGSNVDEGAGGGAPIGSGLVVLLSLGAAYGGRRIYDWKKSEV